MKKYTSQEIKEFVSKPIFDEKVILNKEPLQHCYGLGLFVLKRPINNARGK